MARIGQPGHIGQGQGFTRQKGGCHQFQSRVFGAADGDFPRQAVTAPDPNSVHGSLKCRPRGPEGSISALRTERSCARPEGKGKAGQKAGAGLSFSGAFPGRFGVSGRLGAGLGGKAFLAAQEVGAQRRSQFFGR